jgi:hypothetical protein
MPWWGWLLAGWVVVGTTAGLWMAAAGRIARQRERELRAHQYGTEPARRQVGGVQPAPGQRSTSALSAAEGRRAASARRKPSRMAEFRE